MKWSNSLIPTLKEVPAEAEAKSHVLMLRAGLIRKLGSGAYTYLPAGFRIINKIIAIVREEMDRAGAAEVLMPAIWPIELLKESGRLEAFGEDLIRFTDRHNRKGILAPTHEEVITSLVRDNLSSYKQLPINLYQIQTKFRDEVRPRFGVLRTREFLMKDAYSFDSSQEGLQKSYDAMYDAYCRIFDRCGLEYVIVEAESGAMGGSRSQEFMVQSDIGDDKYVECSDCGYAANIEKAELGPPPPQDPKDSPDPELRETPTPNAQTIEEVSAFLNVPPSSLIKTLLYEADGHALAVLIRGDHELNENKLSNLLEGADISPANDALINKITGAPVGFAGPVGLAGDVEIIADSSVMNVHNGVTGANKADTHLTGVTPQKDFKPDRIADIRVAADSDPCPQCDGKMQMHHGIEIGHVFQLGTKYSDALGATFLDGKGNEKPYIMGCYGIGINRIAAASVETFADNDGLVWPPGIAPWKVAVLCLNTDNTQLFEAAEHVYNQLLSVGIDPILDDREERPGSKFKDADLLGFPVKVIIGRGYEKKGLYELQVRKTGETLDVEEDKLIPTVQKILKSL